MLAREALGTYRSDTVAGRSMAQLVEYRPACTKPWLDPQHRGFMAVVLEFEKWKQKDQQLCQPHGPCLRKKVDISADDISLGNPNKEVLAFL